MNKFTRADYKTEVDIIIFDGYGFGDKVLEDCDFQATWNDKKSKYIVDGPIDFYGKIIKNWNEDPYFSKLNKEYWIRAAQRYLDNVYDNVYAADDNEELARQ